MMWIVGGVVLGLLVFLMIRRKINRAEKLEKFKDLTLSCPKCLKPFAAQQAWVRSGLRGELFRCPVDGEKVWFKALGAGAKP